MNFSSPIARFYCGRTRGVCATIPSSVDLWRLLWRNHGTEYRFQPGERISMGMVSYRKVQVDGFGVFYREAGPPGAPAILLLHGFPTAGHMFRDLIPQLADRFRLVAPDLPGFGQSDMPERGAFPYTFDNLAKVVDRFTEVIGL